MTDKKMMQDSAASAEKGKYSYSGELEESELETVAGGMPSIDSFLPPDVEQIPVGAEGPPDDGSDVSSVEEIIPSPTTSESGDESFSIPPSEPSEDGSVGDIIDQFPAPPAPEDAGDDDIGDLPIQIPDDEDDDIGDLPIQIP